MEKNFLVNEEPILWETKKQKVFNTLISSFAAILFELIVMKTYTRKLLTVSNFFLTPK